MLTLVFPAGAWGYGLFQSDYDLDIIDDLSDEAKTEKVVQELKEVRKAQKPLTGAKDDESDERFYFSICGDYCSEAEEEIVRKHLDSGVLVSIVAITSLCPCQLSLSLETFTDRDFHCFRLSYSPSTRARAAAAAEMPEMTTSSRCWEPAP